MNILVTGAGGFIGNRLVQYLYSQGCNVTALSRSQLIEGVIPDGVNRLVWDLSNPTGPALTGTEAIIHAAARSPYYGGEKADFIRDNYIGTKNLADAAVLAGCKKFLFLSAISVYGHVSGTSVDEKTKPEPTDPYSCSKIDAETFLKRNIKHMAVLTLRLPGVIGEGAHSPWLIKSWETLKAGGHLKAYNPDALFNNVLHVDDLCKFVASVLKKPLRDYDMVALASKTPISIRSALNTINQTELNYGTFDFSDEVRNSFIISIEKAIRKYEFKPRSTMGSIQKLLNGTKNPPSQTAFI